MAGNVQKGFSNTTVPGEPPESPAFLPDPGGLIPPGVDAVSFHPKGVFQRIFIAPVVTPLPGKEGVQLVAQGPVRVTIRFPGWL
jgi:hypothetical protein